MPDEFFGSMVGQLARVAQGRRALMAPNRYDFPMGADPAFVAVGYEISFIPDAVHPYDIDIVKRIRAEVDPVFYPVFRKLVYKSRAGGTYVFRHHGVARYDEDVPDDPIVLAALRPTHWLKGPKPNYIERWFELEHKPGTCGGCARRRLYALPSHFRPYSDWMFDWAANTFWAETPEAKWKRLEAVDAHNKAAKAAEWERLNAEADYRKRDEARMKVNHDAAEQLDSPAGRKEAVGVNLGLERPTVAFSG